MAGDMDGKGMAQDQIVYVEDGFKLSGDPSKLGLEGGRCLHCTCHVMMLKQENTCCLGVPGQNKYGSGSWERTC